MNPAKRLKIVLVALALPLVFLGGMFAGNIYNVSDLLCPSKAEPYMLEQDFVSKGGIIIPKGTVIALRQCAYMQRFNYRFAIDNTTKLKKHDGKPSTDYGFSELFPKSE